MAGRHTYPRDCHDRRQVLETFRRQDDHGVRADFGEPVEAGDKVILDMHAYRRDEHGNKTDQRRLWQALTLREGTIVRIQDSSNQATARQAAGCPPARKGRPANSLVVPSLAHRGKRPSTWSGYLAASP